MGQSPLLSDVGSDVSLESAGVVDKSSLLEGCLQLPEVADTTSYLTTPRTYSDMSELHLSEVA